MKVALFVDLLINRFQVKKMSFIEKQALKLQNFIREAP
jgi:hypothetical protein